MAVPTGSVTARTITTGSVGARWVAALAITSWSVATGSVATGSITTGPVTTGPVTARFAWVAYWSRLTVTGLAEIGCPRLWRSRARIIRRNWARLCRSSVALTRLMTGVRAFSRRPRFIWRLVFADPLVLHLHHLRPLQGYCAAIGDPSGRFGQAWSHHQRARTARCGKPGSCGRRCVPGPIPPGPC
jgi:hypothetical protein